MSFDFEKQAEEAIQKIFDFAEEQEIDCDIIGGILYIDLENGGQYVINKHNINKQIWVSSPVSGAVKYDFSLENNDWQLKGKSLYKTLKSELETQA